MYVAFARCKDYLIIFGSEKDNNADMYSWYDFANFAMKHDSKKYTNNILEKTVSNAKYKNTRGMMWQKISITILLQILIYLIKIHYYSLI